MKLNSLAFISSLIVVCFCLIFSGCDFMKGFGIGTSAQYSLVPSEGLSTDSIPVDDFFYVNLSASYYYGEGHDTLDAIIYAMDEGPGTDCKISVNEDSTEDLYCLLDVMEGDLYYHKIVLEYNIPPGMCEFSGFNVPYHLNQEIVYGPAVVYSCPFIVREGDNTKVENRYCTGSCSPVDSACLKGETDVKGADRNTCATESDCESENCGKLPGRWSASPDACLDKDNQNVIAETDCGNRDDCIDIDHNCGKGNAGAGNWQPGYSCGIGASAGHSEIQEICGNYNKSGQDLGNCCFGPYVVRKETNELASESGKWGDDLKQCIGGPGRFAWDSYNDNGVPIREVTNTGKDGLRDEYELDAIINVHDGHKLGVSKVPSFITANFWEDVEDKEFISSESRVKIYFPPKPEKPFIEAEDIRGEPYFVWTCMDSAREVRHRIILLIREWNTQTEYNRFKESLGSGGDPDVEGEEGSLCDFFTSDERDLFDRDAYCNDLFDLDDWEQRPPYPRGSDPYPEVRYKDSGN